MIKSFEKEKTCCFTGHRVVGKDLDIKRLKEVIKAQVDNGIKNFLVGMAIGFDTLCFNILEEIRLENKINIIACVPCKEQDKLFNLSQKKEYQRMLNFADEIIEISKEYTPYCMMKRNAYMVDNSSILIAYCNSKKGGSFNTVKYAKNQNKKIIMINGEE